MMFFTQSGMKSGKIFKAGKTVVKRVLVDTAGENIFCLKEPSKCSLPFLGFYMPVSNRRNQSSLGNG